MEIAISADDLALLMFEAKCRVLRRDGCHGPDERCGNCEHHERCGNMAVSLVPWNSITPDQKMNLVKLAAEILKDLKERSPK